MLINQSLENIKSRLARQDNIAASGFRMGMFLPFRQLLPIDCGIFSTIECVARPGDRHVD